MTPERLDQIEKLYHSAREREPGERDSFVHQACSGDEELEREVLSLLAQDSGGPMAQPVMEVAASLLGEIKPGTQLGPYRIMGRLGAGGMGEVYRASDTRLERVVAIKTTHAEFSGRFLHEARAISALNHANICTLYDVGPNYLVMEMVEGETLADRLKRGALPRDPVLRYGTQTADALAAAHAKGIIHRDLKPSNIMITKAGIKVLDFGLAKLAPDAGNPETLTDSLTIAGTPAYMAPEQLEGKKCDARADIFALGLVLYEMATGRRAFTGDSRAALIADIMRCEPDIGMLSPPAFAHITERCLAKDPEDRWQTARDVKLELEFQTRANPASKAPAKQGRRLWPIFGAAAAVAILAPIALYLRMDKTEPSVVTLTSYPGNELAPSFSPDGNQVAFAWNGEAEDNYDIYVKQIGPGNPVPLTSNAADDFSPRWSPDGKWIAFARKQGENNVGIYVIPALGGGLENKVGEAYADFTNFPVGPILDWSPDGNWLVVSRRPSPERLPALALLPLDGGAARELPPPPAIYADGAPVFAPDGHALAFVRGWTSRSDVMILPLSRALQPAGEARKLPMTLVTGAFSWSADSRDLILTGGYNANATLWRIPASGTYPPKQLSFAGIAEAPAVSRRGDRMAFVRYVGEYNIWSLELDANGKPAGPAIKAFDSTKSEGMPQFSPDGTKVVFESDRSGKDEIWVCLSSGSNCMQLTTHGSHAGGPRWSPDGSRIAFDVLAAGGSEIHIINSGGGNTKRLTEGVLAHWSRDGKWIYFAAENGQIGRIPASGGEPQFVAAGKVGEESSDGKWLYYTGHYRDTTFLRRTPVSGGPPVEVLSSVGGLNFAVVNDGIWYLTPWSKQGSLLKFYDFASKSSRTVYRTAGPYFAGLTVSPDGRRILYTQFDRPFNQDLMLVEGFR